MAQNDWKIAACLNGQSPVDSKGAPMHEAPVEEWSRVFEDVASEGFKYLELSDGWLKPSLLTSARKKEFLQAAEQTGIKIPSVHIQRASVIQPGLEKENLAYAHEAMEAAAELGVEVFSTGLHQPLTDAQKRAFWFWTAQGAKDPRNDPQTWKKAVSSIRELGKHAESLGMKMSLELYEDTYLGTAQSAVDFIQDVNLPNVGLNPDVGNLIRLHRPVEDWRMLYEMTLPYATYWHLKNYQRDEAPDRSWCVSLPSTLRDGIINYREVTQRAIELGYDGVFVCEHYGGDVLGVTGENARYLTKLLDRAKSRVES